MNRKDIHQEHPVVYTNKRKQAKHMNGEVKQIIKRAH